MPAIRPSWSPEPSRAKLWPRTTRAAVAVRALASITMPSSGVELSDPKGAPTTVSPSNTVREPPVRGPPLRAPPGGPPARGPPVTGRTPSVPWASPVGSNVARWPRPGAEASWRRFRPSRPQPPGHQGQPLLAGASPDRPERHCQPGRQSDQGQHHPAHRRSGPDGHHVDEQTRRPPRRSGRHANRRSPPGAPAARTGSAPGRTRWWSETTAISPVPVAGAAAFWDAGRPACPGPIGPTDEPHSESVPTEGVGQRGARLPGQVGGRRRIPGVRCRGPVIARDRSCPTGPVGPGDSGSAGRGRSRRRWPRSGPPRNDGPSPWPGVDRPTQGCRDRATRWSRLRSTRPRRARDRAASRRSVSARVRFGARRSNVHLRRASPAPPPSRPGTPGCNHRVRPIPLDRRTTEQPAHRARGHRPTSRPQWPAWPPGPGPWPEHSHSGGRDD